MRARRRHELADAAVLVAIAAPTAGLAHALAPLDPAKAAITAVVATAALLLALDFVLGSPVLTRVARRREPHGSRAGSASARPGRTPRGW